MPYPFARWKFETQQERQKLIAILKAQTKPWLEDMRARFHAKVLEAPNRPEIDLTYVTTCRDYLDAEIATRPVR